MGDNGPHTKIKGGGVIDIIVEGMRSSGYFLVEAGGRLA